MAKRDRQARKASQSPVDERGPITMVRPLESPRPEAAGVTGDGDVFTQDVLVKGWKIVGTRGFTEKAKVGSYVGTSR